MAFKRVLSCDSFFFAGKSKKEKHVKGFKRHASSWSGFHRGQGQDEDKKKEVTWADDLVEVIDVSPAPTPPPWPPIKVPWYERCFACFCCCYEADF